MTITEPTTEASTRPTTRAMARLLDADQRPFLTDGGLETSLVFLQGIDLPDFAAFPLLDDEAGRRALRDYYEPYLDVAARDGRGLVLDTPTWRANPDWARGLGYDAAALSAVNVRAVDFVRTLAEESDGADVVLNGVVGPRGDGYVWSERVLELEPNLEDGSTRVVWEWAAIDHLVQAQSVTALGAHRQADQAATVGRHKVDRFGRYRLGGHDQVALVLPILIVHQDHHLALANVLDDLFNAGLDLDWGIVGAGFRPPDRAMRTALEAQDWLTTVVEMDAGTSTARVTSALATEPQTMRRRRP